MTDEEKKPLLAAFKRFLDIQRGVQSRLQAFIQNFETEMHTFFQDYLLPLAGKKISGLKFSKFDRPAPLLPAKRGRPEKEKPDFSRYESNGPSLRKSLRKKSDSQLYAHMELIKNRVRDLYSKSVNPALIAKLYNLNLELVHSLGD